MKKIAFYSITLSSFLLQSAVFADASETTYAIEIDPLTFALDGYSLHARVSPKNLPHWRFGAGIYSMEFPDVFVDMNSDNKNKGWQVELDQGIGLFTEYYLRNNREGWFVGAQLAQQEFSIQNDQTGSQQQQFKNLLLMPYTGYRWPLNNELYVQGWFGVGYTEKSSGNTQLGENNYDIDPLVPFGAIHVGYEF